MEGNIGIKHPGDNGEKLEERIQKALQIYKMSEIYLNDVSDDYGKLKIAQLRLEFARHELFSLFDRAREMGVNPSQMEPVRKLFGSEWSRSNGV